MIFFRFAQSAEIDYNSVWSVDPADERGLPWGKTGENQKNCLRLFQRTMADVGGGWD